MVQEVQRLGRRTVTERFAHGQQTTVTGIDTSTSTGQEDPDRDQHRSSGSRLGRGPRGGGGAWAGTTAWLFQRDSWSEEAAGFQDSR
jgi:hypothetical protein